MRHPELRAIAGLALALVLCAPGAAQARRALVIGIDRYGGAPSGARRFGDLEGAVNDARAFAEVLVARYGFAAQDVELLLNGDATRAGILTGIRRVLVEPSEPGDVAVLYYAGHGSQIRSAKGREGFSPWDQTLVPADAGAGALDVWDKELRALLNDALDAGARVTAFFDSCHSGSIARGLPRRERARFAPPDERDAAEVYAFVPEDPRPPPEERGALVLSAAQPSQTAKEFVGDDGVAHGLFSSALLRVLRTMPVDQPALRAFQSLRALMQTDGCTQEPVLAGVSVDRDDRSGAGRPLFGPAPPGATGRIALAVQSAGDDGVVLQGGRALGLEAGTGLVRAGGGARLVVERVLDLTSSTARVTELEPGARIAEGDLFEVETWVAPREAQLRVWIPAELDAPAFDELLARAAELRRAAGERWVDDPAARTPTHALLPAPGGFELLSAAGAQPFPQLDPERVLAAAGEGARVTAVLPPPRGLREALAFSDVSADSSVEVVESAADANYVLAGRLGEDGVPEYALVLPGGSLGADESDLALPLRTDWAPWSDDAEERGPALARLRAQALVAARVRAWLRLEGPPADPRFPWRPALRDERTGRLLEPGEAAHAGDVLELVLACDEPPRVPERRYVYVFAIDSSGASKLIHPPRGAGSSDNQFPPSGSGIALERVHSLEKGIGVQEPFGTDTLVLLSSKDRALPDPTVLTWGPVASGQPLARMRGEASALERLLTGALGTTRGARPGTPSSWSITRLQIVTRPAATAPRDARDSDS